MFYNDYWSDIYHTLDVINIEKDVFESPIEFQFELNQNASWHQDLGGLKALVVEKEWKEIHVNQK
jgi:hypothetical protein